jgi:hypothetical protein
VPSEHVPDAVALREVAQLLAALRVGRDDLDPAREEHLHGGPARPGEAEDRRAGDLRKVGAEKEAHRSFSVEREKRAKRIATIQNRMMTFDSAQPSSSKWWWSGAIRKRRRPVSLKEPT